MLRRDGGLAVPLIADEELLPPGTPVDESTCLREPIRTPGAVQPHGVLLAARLADRTVVQVSENAGARLGRPLETVLGASLDELLGAPLVDRLLERAQADGGNARPVHEIIGGRPHDVFAHRNADALLVVELEAAEDAGAPDFEAFQTQITGALAAVQDATTVVDLLSTAAQVVRGLTGFDRVWVYRFEPDEHGVIVAEERSEELPAFLGLHYPATDIPPQARALYLENRLRLIGDVDATPVALSPLVNPVTDAWLDLSATVLRAVSPVHVRYLRNMTATASMSIALTVGGRLWGLISAHHYDGPRQVPHPARAACEFVGLACSMQLSTLEDLERERRGAALQRHQVAVVEQVSGAAAILHGLADAAVDLLGVCGAEGVAIRIGGALELRGLTPAADAVDALLDDVGQHEAGDIFVTDALASVMPQHAHLDGVASGVLAVALSRSQGNYIAWFRPERIRTVTWGSHDTPVTREDDGPRRRLDPQASFAAWSESVAQTSASWDATEVDAAMGLRAALGTFVLARAEQLARLNAALASSNAELDAFAYLAAHDLKEPLRGIHNYATFLAEDYHDTLDEAGRAQLAAIMRLARRMGGLLDSLLEYARLDRAELALTDVTLAELVTDASELMHARLTEPGVQLLVLGGDRRLRVDRERLGHLLVNLISNALKYNAAARREVHIGVVTLRETRRGLEMAEHAPGIATGQEIVCVRDNGIGIADEHRYDIFGVFRRLHGPDVHGGGTGVGLSIARRIAERHGGLLWLDESTPGQGSTFCFSVPRA
jgi:two-component system, chemotaxis family, sensor kinase Cph1